MKFPFWLKKDNSDNNSENDTVKFDLFGKIRYYFDPTPQKEKVLSYEDFKGAGDTYYADVSVSYKIAQRITILILIIFLVVSLISNFRNITYDNLFYLVKDFSNAVDIESSDYDTVSYGTDSRHFFALYRGGLAIADPNNISVFTATGRQTLNLRAQFSSPCIEAYQKYFLVYDASGTSFAVYNSFSKVYSESFDYPVTDAAFDESGVFAVVTKDVNHKSLVHIYDDNFERKFTVPSDKYVFDVTLNGKADNIAISYYSKGDGSGRTEISVRKLSTIEEIGHISIDGEFLLQSGYLSDERFAVVTDCAIRIYDLSFEEIESYEYFNSEISGFNINEHGVSVSYMDNSKNICAVFDKKGNLIYNSEVDESVDDVCLFQDHLFLRTDSGIVRIDINSGDEQFLPSDQGKMLIYNSETALVCGESRAEYLVFEK